MSAASLPSARLIPGGAPSAGLRRYHGVAIRTESGSYDLAIPPAMPAAEAATVAALLAAAPAMLAALDSSLDAWRDQFDADDDSDMHISGADFIDWFTQWRASAVAAVALAKAGR